MKIALVPKLTKVEWDMKRLNLTERELKEFYDKQGLNTMVIFDSHQIQKQGLNKIKSIFPEIETVERDKCTRESMKPFDIILAYGGDNHFQYIAHRLTSQIILGVNSDPDRSDGALTSIAINELELYKERILNKKFSIEEWTRLKVQTNGTIIEDLAISEVFIGEEKRFNMSRHILELNGQKEEQKGSGLIVSTGTGSTGWYNSAHQHQVNNQVKFPRINKMAYFMLTEPFRGKHHSYKNAIGQFGEHEKLIVTSLSDTQGILAIDSLTIIPIKEGSKITIELGEPLRVAILK